MLSVYVDLALGLTVSFLLLSLLVSGLNEAVVRLLSIRSKFLWAYLRDTMDGSDAQGRSWLPANPGEVFAALPFTRDPRPQHSDQPSPAQPGELPEREDKAEDAMVKLLYQRVQEIDHPKSGRTSIANIPPGRFAVALMELAASEPDGVEGFLGKLRSMGSPLYGHLKGVWETAQRDLDRFRQGVETWFDGEMQRLSMLYKRYVKWVVAVLGLLVTLVFTMDGLEYAKTLLRDNALRASVTAVAGAGPGAYEELKARCGGDDPVRCVTETLSQPALVTMVDHALVSVSFPAEGDPVVRWNGGAWWDRITTPSHWPGFLLTYVALLFGAPFWWDVLRRVTGLRSRR
ncbi:hypothetical protein FH608_024665 [Nonomuraea phyllanthi]|uniref:Uncharacterized protein n=1 Tax=Nonomuraea phyllanthi TaxID=2219224 RepID=A0A5C4W9V9_9ACTN|nr:hypothetical protein [Nonomuraea phyllanthi]KAB8192680.1 hypothetical protein FH608_024665 [Nonomuraea phyllanthi]QFY08156.1 hypothetical protein GBF35_17045 [Nonomuraea phyllanthi]